MPVGWVPENDLSSVTTVAYFYNGFDGFLSGLASLIWFAVLFAPAIGEDPISSLAAPPKLEEVDAIIAAFAWAMSI